MRRNRRILLWSALTIAAGIIGALVLSVSLQPLNLDAADHGDAPGVKSDLATDITDIYAFRSPENADNIVVVMDVNPHLPGSPPARAFSNDARYFFHVDKDGVLATDEATVTISFSGDPQKWKVEGLTTTPLEGDVTPIGASTPVVSNQGGIKVFCGPRDDPFFFDFVGFSNFLAEPFVPVSGNGLRPSGQTPVDAFAGSNVSSIVIEFPITAVTGESGSNSGAIKVWASTSKAQTSATRILGALNP